MESPKQRQEIDEHQNQVQQPQTHLIQLDIEETNQQPVKRPAPKTFGDLTIIFIFETIGTGLFAYGIVASNGSDFLIAAYLYAAIFLTCKFTGGHVNPAVSFSFYCDDTISSWTLRIYWTAQLLGAVGGAWVAYLILGVVTSPSIKSTNIEWMLADLCGEAFGTFMFVLFIHIQVHEQTRQTNNDIAGIAWIALALFFSRQLSSHSGGCLNPAMGVGLELFEAFWLNDTTKLANFWVFLFAPLFGAYIAQIFYNSIYLPLLKK
ncbi:unnamed protein product [Paramecium primaurelia]|uniref:Aquaporin n=1 Tax=Paramecium primaurelia TaxID=5886 RepID=A0A8S1LDU5_PARPR|nr:unnamed protein product [Paramecium primaurelia]